MNCIWKLLAVVGLFLGAACRSVEPTAQTGKYTLVFLKTGPQSGNLDKDENARVFAGHFANMERLANERKLLVAGPFEAGRSDKSLRGLFVLATADRAQAKAWAETDPPTRAGVFVLEYHDLVTAAPLAANLERDLARALQAKADGLEPKPGDGCRNYVLLRVEDDLNARRGLARLMVEKQLFLIARYDAHQAFAILVAKDVARARELLGASFDGSGECTLDPWFGTDGIERFDAWEDVVIPKLL